MALVFVSSLHSTMTALEVLCREFVLHPYLVAPCTICKLKHLFRLRTVSRQCLTTVESTVCCGLKTDWSDRQTQLWLKILDDWRLFRDAKVAKMLRKRCIEGSSTGLGNSLAWATNGTTRAMSDEVDIEKVQCIICRNVTKCLMAPPISGHVFLRSCLTCFTKYKWPPRRAFRMIRIARICVCGARYELLWRNSYIDGTRALIRLYLYIRTFL